MERQQAHHYVTEVVPALLVVVVIDVCLHLRRQVLVLNFASLGVLPGLDLDDLVRRHVLNVHDLLVRAELANGVGKRRLSVELHRLYLVRAQRDVSVSSRHLPALECLLAFVPRRLIQRRVVDSN